MVRRKVVEGLAGLAARVGELGTLRAVAHAAGISPTVADWRRVFTVDLVGTALPARTLRPLATEGTALVCFASMAPPLGGTDPDPASTRCWTSRSTSGSSTASRRPSGRASRTPASRTRGPSAGCRSVDPPRGHRADTSAERPDTHRLALDEAVLSGIDLLVDGGLCAAVRTRAGRT
ncbi:hypothetical protein [Streptomyces sp. NPDC090798]|uniref:hypothetical protein n=1 Tax=Streptomyces sp. NPDC090798 TaxID=3365968 RepID=UPI0037F6C4BD